MGFLGERRPDDLFAINGSLLRQHHKLSDFARNRLPGRGVRRKDASETLSSYSYWVEKESGTVQKKASWHGRSLSIFG